VAPIDASAPVPPRHPLTAHPARSSSRPWAAPASAGSGSRPRGPGLRAAWSGQGRCAGTRRRIPCPGAQLRAGACEELWRQGETMADSFGNRVVLSKFAVDLGCRDPVALVWRVYIRCWLARL
jgi:hypothetical protein